MFDRYSTHVCYEKQYLEFMVVLQKKKKKMVKPV